MLKLHEFVPEILDVVLEDMCLPVASNCTIFEFLVRAILSAN